MPPSGDPYVDVPLNLGKKNIRLVTLQPGDASESIKCDLQSHALDDECPAYVALSYAWGAKERYDDIHINGMSFRVGRNLWHFLHQMRMQRQDAVFWIDAISIDQANVLEQNHQVQMMREIYTQAFCVWIWLGEADDATFSDVAMQYLKTRVALNGKDVNPKKLWNARKAKAILGLCEKEYWKRIWIVQEVLLARETKVLYGSHCVQWIKIQQLLADLQAISDRGRALHVVGVPAVLDSPAAIIIRAKAQWNGDPQPLTLLLERYHRQHSTDVRDKVYALHGLASDNNTIPINYSIEPIELLVQIMIHYACSPLTFRMDIRVFRRNLLKFSKLMRESLKVFCDEEELVDRLAEARRRYDTSSVQPTPYWISQLLNSQTPAARRPFAVGDFGEIELSGSEETKVFLHAEPESQPRSAFHASAQAADKDSGEVSRRRTAAILGKRRKRYTCRKDRCRRTFDRALDLIRHMRTHKDPRPNSRLSCVMYTCNYRFDHKDQLRIHVWHSHRYVLRSPYLSEKMFDTSLRDNLRALELC